MRIYQMAMKAAEGDESAALWLREHVRNEAGRAMVIACDFDGTLCESEWPDIIAPNEKLLRAVRLMKEMGYVFVLWTCREEDTLQDALDWLKEQGVTMDVVNDNAPSIIEMFGGYNSRKINADEYWDDKAVHIDLEDGE